VHCEISLYAQLSLSLTYSVETGARVPLGTVQPLIAPPSLVRSRDDASDDEDDASDDEDDAKHVSGELAHSADVLPPPPLPPEGAPPLPVPPSPPLPHTATSVTTSAGSAAATAAGSSVDKTRRDRVERRGRYGVTFVVGCVSVDVIIDVWLLAYFA
jgi:hypothetical protein